MKLFLKRYAGTGVFIVLIDVLLALWLAPPRLSGWTSVTVGPGQTLWGLSETYCPHTDPRDVVGAIEARNHIGATIQPGEVLFVPTKVRRWWTRLVF